MLPDNLQIPFTKNNFIYSSQQLDEIVVITILFYFQKKKNPKLKVKWLDSISQMDMYKWYI